MRRLPHITLILAAALLTAADKKPESAKEPAPSAAQIQLWVKQLGDDDFKVREEATRNLIKAGEAAFDAVSKASKSEDGEVRQRALMIIKQIEKAAIAYFKKLGGWVTVDEKSPGRPVIELFLKDTKVTDAGLVHLQGLAKLQMLYLRNTRVTDAGLEHLKGLAKLQTLELGYTKVTDAGLVHLKGLTKLQVIVLGNTKITDAGLVHLKGLANLQELYLWKTKVTNAGLVHLKVLTKLQKLSLNDTKVTDAGLVHLKGLTDLRLGPNSKITDAGLVHLKGLTKLKMLWLYGTNVTRAGKAKLKKALPNCRIDGP